MRVRRNEYAGRVTYYLSTEYGYGDSMEVTPRDLMVLGAWLLEHEHEVVEAALQNDVQVHLADMARLPSPSEEGL